MDGRLVRMESTLPASTLAPIKRCQAKCRDDTDCLNRSQKDEYCWRHYQKNFKTQ